MAVINLLIIACVVFMLVRYVNKVKQANAAKEEAAEPAGPNEFDIFLEISTALQK
jgi:large conductance mechanosensitive channel